MNNEYISGAPFPASSSLNLKNNSVDYYDTALNVIMAFSMLLYFLFLLPSLILPSFLPPSKKFQTYFTTASFVSLFDILNVLDSVCDSW